VSGLVCLPQKVTWWIWNITKNKYTFCKSI